MRRSARPSRGAAATVAGCIGCRGGAPRRYPLADGQHQQGAGHAGGVAEHVAGRRSWASGQHVGSTSAGSVTIMPPAIQPSSMPPSVMMIGKRSISLITSWLPQTMIGIETSMPKITSTMRAGARGLAAPAMAMTLSRLITRSATMMVLMAPPAACRCLDVAVAVFVLGQQQLDADPDQQQRADDFQEGHGEQLQREEDQHDAQHDGAGRAPEDALACAARAAACGRPAR